MQAENERKLKLILGKVVTIEAGKVIYEFRDPLGAGDVYFIIAGMIKMECVLSTDHSLQYYLQPGSVFGLEETLDSEARISRAVAIEKVMLFKWSRSNFYQAANDSRNLAIVTIKSLSRLIRILNAGYSELLGHGSPADAVLTEDNRLGEIDLSIGSSFRVESHHHLRRTFRDKQVLIKEGDIQKHVFWLLSGEVFVTKNVAGKLKVLATLGKGELIGEMSFFDKCLTSATVIAKGDVQAMVFSKKNFKEIFFKNRKWVKQLLLSLSRRVTLMVRKFYKVK